MTANSVEVWMQETGICGVRDANRRSEKETQEWEGEEEMSGKVRVKVVC